jgi:hypothetical protein
MKSFVRASRRLAPMRDFHDKASGYLKNHIEILAKGRADGDRWRLPGTCPAKIRYLLGLDPLDREFFLG